MAYSIQYDPELKDKYPNKRKKSTAKEYVLALLLFVAIAFMMITTDIRTLLKGLVLPGDPERTEAALVTFTNNVQKGEGVRESLTAFCMELLNETKPPQ